MITPCDRNARTHASLSTFACVATLSSLSGISLSTYRLPVSSSLVTSHSVLRDSCELRPVRTHRFRAPRPLILAQPGVVRGFRLRTKLAIPAASSQHRLRAQTLQHWKLCSRHVSCSGAICKTGSGAIACLSGAHWPHLTGLSLGLQDITESNRDMLGICNPHRTNMLTRFLGIAILSLYRSLFTPFQISKDHSYKTERVCNKSAVWGQEGTAVPRPQLYTHCCPELE